MRFASVIHDGQPLAVAIDGDRATALRGVTQIGRQTPASLLREPPLEDGSLPLSDLRFRPVVPNPGKVVCIGLNYLAHIEETNRGQSDYPVLFTKFASSLTGPYDPAPLPPEAERSTTRGSWWSSSARPRDASRASERSTRSLATPWATT